MLAAVRRLRRRSPGSQRQVPQHGRARQSSLAGSVGAAFRCCGKRKIHILSYFCNYTTLLIEVRCGGGKCEHARLQRFSNSSMSLLACSRLCPRYRMNLHSLVVWTLLLSMRPCLLQTRRMILWSSTGHLLSVVKFSKLLIQKMLGKRALFRVVVTVVKFSKLPMQRRMSLATARQMA